MHLRSPAPRRCAALVAVALAAVVLAACSLPAGSSASGTHDRAPLRVGAIPDQDPEKLQRLHSLLAEYLAGELGVVVEYVPVTDYTAAVSLFRTGDLDLVWFGGLTGVQARLQTPGARVVAQRDVDAQFRSVFIANRASGLAPVTTVEGLRVLRGRRFTFGSESSTSGRLMPQWFLRQAGVSTGDFAGAPGFSGSHDKTIELVQSGTFEAGALNEQVWRARLAAGTVDEARVAVLLRTPPYPDYHWVLGPGAAARFGPEFAARVRAVLLAMSSADPEAARVLELFGAGRFIPAAAGDYARIEQVARSLDLIS